MTFCLCSLDIELLTSFRHPYYLLKVFAGVILAAAYIPPSVVDNNACDVISSIVAKIQTQHSNAFMALECRFVYSNVNDSYVSKARLPLNQITVFLCSEHKW